MNVLRLNSRISSEVFGERFHAEYFPVKWVCFTLNFCRLNGPVLCRILVGVLFILCCGRIGHFTISFGLVFVAFWSRRKCSIILLYGSILFVVQWSFFRETFFLLLRFRNTSELEVLYMHILRKCIAYKMFFHTVF